MESETVCIANIGPRERRKRLIFGTVSLALGIVIASVLISRGSPIGWRAGLFLPLMSAALGFFQWREKT
jgi:UPF0716 family protein affecting phage T7 exclusion